MSLLDNGEQRYIRAMNNKIRIGLAVATTGTCRHSPICAFLAHSDWVDALRIFSK